MDFPNAFLIRPVTGIRTRFVVGGCFSNSLTHGGCCLACSPDANDANFPCKSRHISPNTEVAHTFSHLLTLSFPCSFPFLQVRGLIIPRCENSSDKKFFRRYPQEGRESTRYAECLSWTNRKYRVVGTIIPKDEQRLIAKHCTLYTSCFLHFHERFLPIFLE